MVDKLITNQWIESFQTNDVSAWIGISGGYNLRCNSLLRYVGNDDAFITNEDHGQKFGLPAPFDAEAEIAKRIQGKTITSAELKSDTGDLTLHFDDGRLELLCSSSGYENWTLDGPNGLLIVGYGRRAKKFIIDDNGGVRES